MRLLLVLLTAFCVSSCGEIKVASQRAEVLNAETNGRMIKLLLDEFAMDHEGQYPPTLKTLETAPPERVESTRTQ